MGGVNQRTADFRSNYRSDKNFALVLKFILL